MKYNKFINKDTIVLVDNMINEDDRTNAISRPGITYNPVYDDPLLKQQNNYGSTIQSMLKGSGFDVEVTDFNKWVTIRCSAHSYKTGRSVSKTFIVVFNYKSDSQVYASSTRYRSVSGASQAASYIRSYCNNLISDANRM